MYIYRASGGQRRRLVFRSAIGGLSLVLSLGKPTRSRAPGAREFACCMYIGGVHEAAYAIFSLDVTQILSFSRRYVEKEKREEEEEEVCICARKDYCETQARWSRFESKIRRWARDEVAHEGGREWWVLSGAGFLANASTRWTFLYGSWLRAVLRWKERTKMSTEIRVYGNIRADVYFLLSFWFKMMNGKRKQSYRLLRDMSILFYFILYYIGLFTVHVWSDKNYCINGNEIGSCRWEWNERFRRKVHYPSHNSLTLCIFSLFCISL